MRHRTPKSIMLRMTPEERRCHRLQVAYARRQKNIEKYRAYDRDWNAKNPVRRKLKARRANLKKLYGLSVSTFDAMLMGQNNCCAVCRGTQLGPNGWEVDHDHSTNLVRGIVCSACNRMLAGARDNIGILQMGISYLLINNSSVGSN